MQNQIISTYAEIKKLKPATLRGTLRNLALDALSINVDTSVFKKNRIQFLYIHHVFQDEENNFRKLLNVLAKDHTFISYSEAVERIINNNIDKPYIAFSSDDGVENNLRAAAILKEFNATACFFINPGIIGTTENAAIVKYCHENLQFHPVSFLNWNQVGQLQNDGHEIGNHTMWHMNIAAHNKQQIVDDISNALSILRKNCGNEVKHFAFPFGRFFHFSEEGRKAVFETGHASCTTAERGCHIPSEKIKAEDLSIRRDHVVLGWKLNHILHFLSKSAKVATKENNFYPANFK